MYNRYIPGPNGVYQIKSVQEPEHSSNPPPNPSKNQREQFPVQKGPAAGIDLGDLLLLCIALLIMLDGEEDMQSVLITAAVFLFLQ